MQRRQLFNRVAITVLLAVLATALLTIFDQPTSWLELLGWLGFYVGVMLPATWTTSSMRCSWPKLNFRSEKQR